MKWNMCDPEAESRDVFKSEWISVTPSDLELNPPITPATKSNLLISCTNLLTALESLLKHLRPQGVWTGLTR